MAGSYDRGCRLCADPYLASYGYEHWHHGLPLITSALGTLILIGPMIIRRPPKRVTPNPSAFVIAAGFCCIGALNWIFVVGQIEPVRWERRVPVGVAQTTTELAYARNRDALDPSAFYDL
jgi:hypothetical protein